MFLNIIAVLFLTSETPVATAKFTDTPPIIDGRLEEVWKKASVITEFVQIIPDRGAPPTESTKVYILYCAHNLYIGFKCFDDPAKVRADTRIRDHQKVGWDDAVFVMLDTYHDRNSGYSFGVNAIGTQRDAMITDNGHTILPEWDGRWTSKTSITEFGWEVEISIPFSTIRFDRDKDTWGFNIQRGVTRKMEGLSLVLASNQLRVSEWGELKIDLQKIDVEALADRDRFLFSPYLSYRFDRETQELLFGVNTAQYLVSDDIRIELCLRPDYAHIEADVDEFDLDKLPRWLPERRPFFTEGLALFSTPLSLIYTRSIGDILGGAKITGRLKGVEMGVFGTITDTIPREETVCIRLRKPFLANRIGLTGIWNQNPSNQILSIDGSTSLIGIFSSFQVARSWWNNDRSKLAYYGLINRRVDSGINFAISHQYIPSNFKNVRGHHPLVGLRVTSYSLSPRFIIPGAILRGIMFNAGYTNWIDENRKVIREVKSGGMTAELINNLRADFTISREQRQWRGILYTNLLYRFGFAYAPGGHEHISISYLYGEHFGRILHFPSLHIGYSFFGRLNIRLGLNYQRTRMDGTTTEELIAVFIPSYNLTRDLNLRLFTQWSDRKKELTTNFLIDYNFRDIVRIHLVLNEERCTDSFDTIDPSTVFFKVSPHWQF